MEKIQDLDEYYNGLDDYSRGQWDDFHAAIQKFEGPFYEHPYRDVRGFRTTCRGHNVDDKDTFLAQPWTIGEEERPATQAEKSLYYDQLGDQPFGQDYDAKQFEDATPLRLSEEYCQRLYNKHVVDSYNDLMTKFPNFGQLPLPAHMAIMEPHYQTGDMYDRKEWPKLNQYAEELNQKGICENIRRDPYQDGVYISNMKQRNNWAYQKCMEESF